MRDAGTIGPLLRPRFDDRRSVPRKSSANPASTMNTHSDRTGSADRPEGLRPTHLLDTITAIDASHAGGVVVSGSHGGVSSTGFVLRAPARPRAVFFNDAGVGKDRAGIVALELLDAIGVACAVYAHDSARIGDARDGYENGVLSFVNETARGVGVRAGQSVQAALRRFGAAPPK